jgi:hypothetical protein
MCACCPDARHIPGVAGLTARASPQVYTLKRLARGLASSNKGARQGYALALTTALQQLQCVSPAGMLDLVDSSVEVKGSQKGPVSHPLTPAPPHPHTRLTVPASTPRLTG